MEMNNINIPLVDETMLKVATSLRFCSEQLESVMTALYPLDETRLWTNIHDARGRLIVALAQLEEMGYVPEEKTS